MEMYIGLAVLVVVLVWVIMTYNRFISLRRFKDEAWSGIAVQLKRRHDLAPNLLSLVKRYAQHEKELLEELGRQRSVLVGSTKQIADSERHYSATLGRIFALGEAWRDLNILVESFPSLLLARLFKFKAEAFFELDSPEEAQSPRME